MGTRGTFGFFYKGKYYVCYNQYDSYPEGLGVKLLLEILSADLDEWRHLLENIVIVDESVPPSQAQIQLLAKYTNLNVSTKSTNDWYCLLHKTQGSFHHVLHSGFMMNHADENGNPYHEEYTYILNFDKGTFEFSDNHDYEPIDLQKEFPGVTFVGDFFSHDKEGDEDKKPAETKAVVQLNHGELRAKAQQWSEKPLPESYDPEEELYKQSKGIEATMSSQMINLFNVMFGGAFPGTFIAH